MAENKYPEDEFDLLAKERTVTGTHRRVKSNMSWWIALIAVIVLAPTAGWAYIHFLGVPNFNHSARPSATSTTSVSNEPSEESTPTSEMSESSPALSPSREATPTPSPTPTVKVDHNKSVVVFNAAGVRGLAAAKQAILEKEGFTSISIGNYQYEKPAASQIFYPAEADEATVKAIATALGISESNFILNADATKGDQIVVVLAGDI